ncbi:MAG: hypothetical protein GX556_18865 [Fibrobacter sp.]|nr:hypothetical protein [Fibrobacter sp.]
MEKKSVNMIRCLHIITILVTSISAQWVKTNWTGENSFLNLYSGGSKVVARTWDALNGDRMFLTNDNGANWTLIGSVDSGIDVLSSVLLDDNLLAGTWEGLIKSPLSSISWDVAASTGMSENTAVWSIAKVNNTLFAGGTGSLYKSSDNGLTWTELKSGISANARITSITGNGETVFAGSDSSGVFMSTNGGTSWTAINSGLTDKRISRIAVMGNKLFAITLTGVFQSVNNGSSWNAAGSMPAGLVNCILVVNDKIFAGTDTGGVYISADSGAAWTSFNEGMHSRARILSLVSGENALFAGTDSGVMRIPYLTTGVEKNLTVHPDHFKPRFINNNGSSATLLFMLSASQKVDIELYNLRGSQVLSPVHKKLEAGARSVSFNTGSIAPGSYVLRFKAGRTVYQQTISIQR